MSDKEMVRQHIEKIDRRIQATEKLAYEAEALGLLAEFLKAKSLALIALRTK